MIYETVRKARHVLEFDTDKPVDKEVMKDLLEKTYEITPSKNNMVAWQVHVLGPEHQNYKDILYEGSAKHDTRSNKGTDIPDIGAINEEQGIPRQYTMYRCLNTAPYVLILTETYTWNSRMSNEVYFLKEMKSSESKSHIK